MAFPVRFAVLVTVLLIVCSACARAPVEGSVADELAAPGDAPRANTSPALTIEELDQRVSAVSLELEVIRNQIEVADGVVVAAEATLLRARPGFEEARQAFWRASDRAGRRAVASALGLPKKDGTVADATAPLQMLSDALHQADAFETVILEEQGRVERGAADLRRLGTDIRRLRYRLAVSGRSLGRLASQARMTLRRSLAVRGPESAAASESALTDRLDEAFEDAHVSELELRRLEGLVLTSSVRLESRRPWLMEALRRVAAERRALNEDMIVVEGIVAGRYGAWFEGAPPIGAPVIGGVLNLCPVDPPHAYSDTFGDPRYAGGYHPHAGTDIFAPEGTPVRAPFPGVAEDAANALGGNAVRVLGEDGYVYMAHLDRYGELGQVEAGTVVGYVGNTGDAIHSAPHLHFEWHPGDGDPVDPYPYLNAVCLPPSS